MTLKSIYPTWTEIGPAVHPVDGEGGYVYRTAVGVEILRTATGVIRTLPHNWRTKQPESMKGLAALAAGISKLV